MRWMVLGERVLVLSRRGHVALNMRSRGVSSPEYLGVFRQREAPCTPLASPTNMGGEGGKSLLHLSLGARTFSGVLSSVDERKWCKRAAHAVRGSHWQLVVVTAAQSIVPGSAWGTGGLVEEEVEEQEIIQGLWRWLGARRDSVGGLHSLLWSET